MADTWRHEDAKLLIEEAVQNELNTMHNKKLVNGTKSSKEWPMEGTQEVHNRAVLKVTT